MATFKRIILLVLLILTGLSAVVTVIGVMSSGGGGRMWGTMMGSALGLGYLVVASFSALVAMERPAIRWLAVAGMCISALMVVEFPAYLIFDSVSGSVPWAQSISRAVGCLTGTGMVLAGYFCGNAFVLAPRMNVWGRMLQLGTAVAMLAALVAFQLLIWGEWGYRSDLEQILPATIILSVAGTISVWVLHKFFGIKVKDVLSSVRETIFLRCPRCLNEQEVVTGESACAVCKLRIKIEVEEPKCPKCGYNLHQLTRPICPECGTCFGTAADKAAQSENLATALTELTTAPPLQPSQTVSS